MSMIFKAALPVLVITLLAGFPIYSNGAEGAANPGQETKTESASVSEGRSGETIYNSFCTACHTPGALGAPRMGDTDDWQARLDEKGLDTLHAHAMQGFNGMPARGLCMDCTDDEVIGTVDYILDQSLEPSP